MCIILRVSIKTNLKISCGLGGVYFRVIILDSVTQSLFTIFGDIQFETFSN